MKTVLALAICLGWSCFVYRYERLGVEGALYVDHQVFMGLRSQVKNEWEFLGKAISFDRARGRASNFLFRPALGAYLATLDYFFRDNFPLWGLSSLLLNGLCGFVLFLLLGQLLPRALAGILALTFIAHFSGSTMVSWRHVSGYIFGIGLFGVALGEIARAATERRRARLAVLLPALFFSALFHENTAYALIPLLGGMAISQRWWGTHWEWAPGMPIRGKELAALAGVTVIYLLWNLADLLVRQPAGGFMAYHPFYQGSLWGFVGYLGQVFRNILYVLGSFPAAFLLPQVNQLPWEFQKVVFGLSGLVVSAGMGRAAWSLRRPGRTVTSPELLLWWSGLYLLSLAVSLGAIRLVHGGYFYLAHSRYYQYFGNFVCLLFLAVGLRRLGRERLRGKAAVVLGLVFCNLLYFSIVRHRRVGLKTYAQEKAQATWIAQMSHHILPGECLASGSEFPALFLYRKSCAARGGNPLSREALLQRFPPGIPESGGQPPPVPTR